MTSATEARARRLNNLPTEVTDDRPLPQRILTSWWTWLAVGLTIIFVACLASLYFELTADQPAVEGTVPGVNPSAIRQAAWYATSTLLFWIVLFLAADRWRPQRWVVWYLSLGWGASVATFVSYHVNSWAAMQMQVTGDFDPATSARWLFPAARRSRITGTSCTSRSPSRLPRRPPMSASRRARRAASCSCIRS